MTSKGNWWKFLCRNFSTRD